MARGAGNQQANGGSLLFGSRSSQIMDISKSSLSQIQTSLAAGDPYTAFRLLSLEDAYQGPQWAKASEAAANNYLKMRAEAEFSTDALYESPEFKEVLLAKLKDREFMNSKAAVHEKFLGAFLENRLNEFDPVINQALTPVELDVVDYHTESVVPVFLKSMSKTTDPKYIQAFARWQAETSFLGRIEGNSSRGIIRHQTGTGKQRLNVLQRYLPQVPRMISRIEEDYFTRTIHLSSGISTGQLVCGSEQGKWDDMVVPTGAWREQVQGDVLGHSERVVYRRCPECHDAAGKNILELSDDQIHTSPAYREQMVKTIAKAVASSLEKNIDKDPVRSVKSAVTRSINKAISQTISRNIAMQMELDPRKGWETLFAMNYQNRDLEGLPALTEAEVFDLVKRVKVENDLRVGMRYCHDKLFAVYRAKRAAADESEHISRLMEGLQENDVIFET